ncbi:hypothetical protein LCGC14_0327990 [marine sediment metagenome]|uniref:Uncharacterized protein n=1 Tax=marine sediment metagenome TaxID=412755 RepID=A0A0F9TH74_9ZZZZ
MSATVFRRQLRMQIKDGEASIDSLLVKHIEALEEQSPHVMQEWMRHALRNQFSRDQAILNKKSGGGVDEA